MSGLIYPNDIDYDSSDAVVMWLVYNMATQTDDNAFLTSHLFVVGNQELTGLLGSVGALQAEARIHELHFWKCNAYVKALAETDLDNLLRNFDTRGLSFDISRAAQALHFLRHCACIESEQYKHSFATLQTKLVPNLEQYIRCIVASRARDASEASERSNLSLSLALVNTVTLYLRTLELLGPQDLEQVLGLLQHFYQECPWLNIYSKTSVLAHVLLNLQGQCPIKHVAWIFDCLDMWQPLLQGAFCDLNNPHRDILLDLAAEVVTGYRYFDHWTPSRMRYEWFVASEAKRKYRDRSDHVYRFYAHADFPSDHEALSLYHMMISSRRGPAIAIPHDDF